MSSIPIVPNIKELWNMSPEEFNNWRIENDLPILFDYFSNKLPGFENWIKENSLKLNYIIKVVPTGELFKGDSEKFIIEYEDENILRVSKKPKQEIINRNHKINKYKIKKITSFTPYFIWAKEKLGENRYIVSDKLNNQYSTTFIYNLWSAPQNAPELSRASLFKEFKVLKLGGVSIGNRTIISGKNLDFVDIDHLKVSGYRHGSKSSNISFSSCKSMKLTDANLHHFDFYNCELSKLVCKNSRLQDFKFSESILNNINFDNTKIINLTFDKSKVSEINFYKCDINKIDYSVANDNKYIRVFDNFRRIRTAFQNIGKRRQAQKYYYLERCYERKTLFNPYLKNRDLFPPLKYGGNIKEIYSKWKNKTFSNSKSLSLLWILIKFHLKVWIIPKYFIHSLKFKLKYLASLMEYFIWGYGEKPIRIVLNALLTVIIYTMIYFNSSHIDLANSLVNSFYFSIITFTTLGYGDIQPNSNFMKLICGSEALLGILAVGLIVAGFSNKSEY